MPAATTPTSTPGVPTRLKVVTVMAPVLYMALIYWFSSIPGTATVEDPSVYVVVSWLPPRLQNLLHIPLFGVLAWLWYRSLYLWLGRNRRPQWVGAMAFLITSAYGVLDEFHQAFVPGRYASLTDIILNVIGAMLAIWLCRRLARPTTLAS